MNLGLIYGGVCNRGNAENEGKHTTLYSIIGLDSMWMA